MVREALTVLRLAVLVSGTLGALIYLGADALMVFLFCGRNHMRGQHKQYEDSRTTPYCRSDVIFITNVHATG